MTLDFYTRTLNDELYTGTLCVYLFKRHEVGSPPTATDTLLTQSERHHDYWNYNPGGIGLVAASAWKEVRSAA